MNTQLLEQLKEHITYRISLIETTDQAFNYLEMFNCMANLCWENENKALLGSDFKREWKINNLKIRVEYGKNI